MNNVDAAAEDPLAAFSRKVSDEMRKRLGRTPPEAHIATLAQILFYASLQTDENRSTRIRVAYLDPSRPGHDQFRSDALDHWRLVTFGSPQPFSVDAVVKLSHSSDQRTSILVVYPDADNELRIWGFVDQQSRYRDFVEHESEQLANPPGQFQWPRMTSGFLSRPLGI